VPITNSSPRRAACSTSASASERAPPTPTFGPEIQIHYTVGDRSYEIWTYDISFQFVVDLFQQSRPAASADRSIRTVPPIPLLYDPQDPAIAVVSRGYSAWLWFAAAAAGGVHLHRRRRLIYTLLHWGKSVEHRAATTQLAARLDLLAESTAVARDYPHVPRDANLTNSPGTRLKYRLPINTMLGWKLLVAGRC